MERPSRRYWNNFRYINSEHKDFVILGGIAAAVHRKRKRRRKANDKASIEYNYGMGFDMTI